MTKDNSEFTALFWNTLSLSELFEEFHVGLDTGDREYGKIWFEASKHSNTLEPLGLTRNILVYTRIYEEVNPDNEYLYNNNTPYYKQQESVYIELMPSPKIRLRYDGADDDTIFTGSLDDFNDILASIPQEPGSMIVEGERDYEYVTLVNEVNFFASDGFKSTNRTTAASLADPLLIKEYDYAYGQIDTEIYLVRSFKIRQSESLETWLSDGLFVVDGQMKTPSQYNDGSFPYFSSGVIFTLGGVHLGDFEEDYEYRFGEDYENRLGSSINYYYPPKTETDLRFYDASKVNKLIAEEVQKLFPKEISALNTASAAPIFVGYEGSYLGFDWLTSMPASTSSFDNEVVSLIGANAAIFSANQLYIALEDCDIITSSGKDLIILADDANNTSTINVPRVHDFEKGEDKILIPTEVFLGFEANPTDKLARGAFASDKNATTEDQRIIYDITSGNLYHDIDGNGTATQQLIAVFINKPLLSETDILLGHGNGIGTAGAITGNGAFREGVTLSAPVVTGDPDGDATNPNYSYQWFKGSTAITNATASTYAVPASGAGIYKVAVTYTDAQGFIATLDSPEQDILTGIKILDSSTGATKVAGNDGITDQFALQTNAAPSTPFRITEFNPTEDFLQIPQELAGSTAPRTFFGVAKMILPDRPLTKSEKKSFGKQQKAVSKSVKSIGRTGHGFAYNQLTGELFLDTNGKKKGFGVGGGLLAVLEDTPAIGIDNFQFLQF